MIYINLLPEEEKKKRKTAHHNFSLALICAGVIIAGILTLTFCYSFNIIYASELQTLQNQTSQEARLIKPNNELKEKVVFINDRTRELNNLRKNAKSLADLFASFNKNIPADIQISNFSLNHSTIPQGTVGGYAPSQEKIAELINKLEALPYFQDVRFESSSLYEGKVSFILSLSLEEGNK